MTDTTHTLGELANLYVAAIDRRDSIRDNLDIDDGDALEAGLDEWSDADAECQEIGADLLAAMQRAEVWRFDAAGQTLMDPAVVRGQGDDMRDVLMMVPTIV